MASVWKTAGMGAAAALAVPVAGLSGLAAAGFTLIFVLAMFGVGPARLSQTSLWELLTSKLMLYLLVDRASAYWSAAPKAMSVTGAQAPRRTSPEQKSA